MTSFDPRLVQYNADRTQRFYKLLAERVREIPCVRSETLTQNVPLGQDYFDFDGAAFVPDGIQMPADRENFSSTMDTVDEGYFQTMGIPILRGRGFLKSDTADAPRVAVVNERFAKHYWPGADAVGTSGSIAATARRSRLYAWRRPSSIERLSKSRWISCICRWPSILSRE